MLWMSLYFSFGAWWGISLMHAPRYSSQENKDEGKGEDIDYIEVGQPLLSPLKA